MESESMNCLPEGGKLLRMDERDPRSVPVNDFLCFPIYPESILRVHSPAPVQQKFVHSFPAIEGDVSGRGLGGSLVEVNVEKVVRISAVGLPPQKRQIVVAAMNPIQVIAPVIAYDLRPHADLRELS